MQGERGDGAPYARTLYTTSLDAYGILDAGNRQRCMHKCAGYGAWVTISVSRGRGVVLLVVVGE